MIQKIDELKEPPIVGKYYLVPCVYYPEFSTELEVIGNVEYHEDNNGGYYISNNKKTKLVTLQERYIPIINHPHEDKQSGQNYFHYHIDTRFDNVTFNKSIHEIRINLDSNIIIKYITLKCKNLFVEYKTLSSFIKINKLKHKCIYKGKCPHRGMDLSQEVPVNGVITCPLHSLQFNAETKQLIQ